MFKNISVLMEPGTSSTFKISIAGLETLGNPISFLNSPLSINISSRKCSVGE